MQAVPVLSSLYPSLISNLKRVASPPNWNTDGSLIFSVSFSYFLFTFYLPRYTLPDFSSIFSLASLPFLSCWYETTTIFKSKASASPVAKVFLQHFLLLFPNNLGKSFANSLIHWFAIVESSFRMNIFKRHI